MRASHLWVELKTHLAAWGTCINIDADRDANWSSYLGSHIAESPMKKQQD
jgi:hypothetical protein